MHNIGISVAGPEINQIYQNSESLSYENQTQTLASSSKCHTII